MKRIILPLLVVSFLLSPQTHAAVSRPVGFAGAMYGFSTLITLGATLSSFIRALGHWDDVKPGQSQTSEHQLDIAGGYALASTCGQFLPLAIMTAAVHQIFSQRVDPAPATMVLLTATALASSVPVVLNGLEASALSSFVGVDDWQTKHVESSQHSAYMWVGFSSFSSALQVANAVVLWISYVRLRSTFVAASSIATMQPAPVDSGASSHDFN